jgi:hypothetical protein
MQQVGEGDEAEPASEQVRFLTSKHSLPLLLIRYLLQSYIAPASTSYRGVGAQSDHTSGVHCVRFECAFY